MLFLLSRLKIKIKYYYFVYTKKGGDRQEGEGEGGERRECLLGNGQLSSASTKMEQQCMNPNRSSVCLSSNSRTFMNIRMSDHSWTLEWAIRGNRGRPMTPPSENRGAMFKWRGGGGEKQFFLCFSEKKVCFICECYENFISLHLKKVF